MAKGPKIISLVFEKFICMLFKSVHCCNCWKDLAYHGRRSRGNRSPKTIIGVEETIVSMTPQKFLLVTCICVYTNYTHIYIL